MRVFVLCTGRCGSTSFAAACSHITNFSAAHESGTSRHGPGRVAYPDSHIEVDNRLSWFLGDLDARYGDTAHYVHLTRDPEEVAQSFLKRWTYTFRGGLIEAFAHGLLMAPEAWPVWERESICRHLVSSVTRNIDLFLRDKTRVSRVDLASAAVDFTAFWEAIGAEGDLDAALAEWDVRHNAGP